MEDYYQARIDQQELRDYLRERPNWIMSNDDNERTQELYAGFAMARPKYEYGGGRRSNELLIFSNDLTPS